MGIKKGTKLTNTPKTVNWRIRVDEETDAKAKAVCEKEGITKSELVRQGVEIQAFLNSEIRKCEKILADREREAQENRDDARFDNEASIICVGSMLTAYRNVLDEVKKNK